MISCNFLSVCLAGCWEAGLCLSLSSLVSNHKILQWQPVPPLLKFSIWNGDQSIRHEIWCLTRKINIYVPVFDPHVNSFSHNATITNSTILYLYFTSFRLVCLSFMWCRNSTIGFLIYIMKQFIYVTSINYPSMKIVCIFSVTSNFAGLKFQI